MTKEQLAEIVSLHGKWLRREDGGQRANFANTNLVGANLVGVNLRGANFGHANLRRADLTYANLTYANLTCANLGRATLTAAYLAYADLPHANFTGATLMGVNFTGANLARANFGHANLRRANLTGANLTGADLTGADLAHAIGLGAANAQQIGFGRVPLDKLEERKMSESKRRDRELLVGAFAFLTDEDGLSAAAKEWVRDGTLSPDTESDVASFLASGLGAVSQGRAEGFAAAKAEAVEAVREVSAALLRDIPEYAFAQIDAQLLLESAIAAIEKKGTENA